MFMVFLFPLFLLKPSLCLASFVCSFKSIIHCMPHWYHQWCWQSESWEGTSLSAQRDLEHTECLSSPSAIDWGCRMPVQLRAGSGWSTKGTDPQGQVIRPSGCPHPFAGLCCTGQPPPLNRERWSCTSGDHLYLPFIKCLRIRHFPLGFICQHTGLVRWMQSFASDRWGIGTLGTTRI